VIAIGRSAQSGNLDTLPDDRVEALGQEQILPDIVLEPEPLGEELGAVAADDGAEPDVVLGGDRPERGRGDLGLGRRQVKGPELLGHLRSSIRPARA